MFNNFPQRGGGADAFVSRKRLSIAAAIFTLIVMQAGTAQAADTLSKIRDSETLTIAYRETPPFSFTNENKQVVGYSVDVCLKVAEAVKHALKLRDLKIAWLPVDTTTRFSSIIESKADLECGSTTNNADRRTRVAFTISHFFSSVRMVVKQSSGIHTWQDLKERTLATTHNTTTVALINARSNARSLNLKVLEANDDQQSFAYVESGKADAFAMDDVLLYSFRSLAKHPEDFIITGEPLSVEPYSIMFRRDDPEFKKLVDNELMRLISTGELQKSYHHWFQENSGPQGRNMNMPMTYLLRESLRFPSDKVAD